jgi:hypothetical protein
MRHELPTFILIFSQCSFSSCHDRLILAFLAFINYVKVKVVDDHMKPVHFCFLSSPDDPGSSSHQTDGTSQIRTLPYSQPILYGLAPGVINGAYYMETGSRALSGTEYTEAELCREYFLSYSVFLAFMLTMFLLALLIASEVYMGRLLGKVLEVEIDLQWKDVKEEEEEEESFLLQGGLETHQPECKDSDLTQSLYKPLWSLDAAPSPSKEAPPPKPPRGPRSPIVSLAPVLEDYIPQPSRKLQGSGVETRRGARSVTPGLESSMYTSVFGGKAQSLNRGGLVAGSERRGGCLSAFGCGRRGVERTGSHSSSLLPPQNVLDELKQQQSDMNGNSGKSGTFVKYILNLLPAEHLNSRYECNSTPSCKRWNAMSGRLHAMRYDVI